MANDRTQDKDTTIKDKAQPMNIGGKPGESEEFIDEINTMDTANAQTDENELLKNRADDDKAPESRSGRR